MKDLTSPKDVKKMMTSSKPVAIFFYMDGCPHCEAMKGPWLDIESENPNVDFAEVESANVPPELGIYAFPKFMKIGGGKKVTVEGEMSKDELKKKLFVGGRRRTRGRLIRRIRKRHSRTTRRNIPS
jgi:thiol-disulfide isomerase/thioredoxin